MHTVKAAGSCLAKKMTVFICNTQSRPLSWKAIFLDDIYSPVFSVTGFLSYTVSGVITM